MDLKDLGNNVLRRKLKAVASSLYNNTKIFCKTIPKDVESKVATLTVQGTCMHYTQALV